MLGSSILKDRNHLLFIIESLVLQKFFVVGFQSLSCVQLFATPWTAAHQASLSSTISQSLLKFTSIKLVMLFNHLILCRPLLHLPSIFPSISVFPNALILGIRWPKYWNFSFSISPSSEYSGLICFRIDWFDLLAVQGTLTNSKIPIEGMNGWVNEVSQAQRNDKSCLSPTLSFLSASRWHGMRTCALELNLTLNPDFVIYQPWASLSLSFLLHFIMEPIIPLCKVGRISNNVWKLPATWWVSMLAVLLLL